MMTPPGPNYADLLFHRNAVNLPPSDAGYAIGMALHLKGPRPDLGELRAQVAAKLPGLPCLTHRLTDPPAAWTPTEPDLDAHIVEQRLPQGPGRLDEALRELLREPLSADAPPWRLVLLHGHAPEGSVLLYLTHHAVQDGGSAISVLEALFGPPLHPSQYSVANRMPRLRPTEAHRSLPALLRGMKRHRVWRLPDHPLSADRHLLWAETPLVQLRKAARAGGCGANDVHLAALAHAVAGWAGEHWPPAANAPLPVLVPVNLRTPEEAALPGNRLFAVRVDLPGGPSSLARRLALSARAAAPLRSVSHRAVLHRITTALPDRLLARAAETATDARRVSIGCSFLLMRHRLHVQDADVTRVVPLMFCPEGTPMSVSLLAYRGVAVVCFRIDKALPGAETVPARWRAAVEELADGDARRTETAPAPAGAAVGPV